MPNRIVKVILRGDVSGLVAPFAAAGRTVADTANNLTAAGTEAEKTRKHLSTLGDTAGKVGLVAAAGVGAIVVASANFEQSMSRVEAATHESAGTMEELRKAAIVAGRDTVFSATESADAITAMSKAGVTAKDILAGGLNGALSLASAGELDVAQAADIAATAMNQFGLTGKDVGHIADVLAAGAGKAQGEVTDMAASLKFVGPVAHQMNISLDETVGTIAELASQGVVGEQAGTSLRGMLTALTSPSKLATKEMQALGISLYDTNGQFVGLRGVAGQLQQTMSGLTNAERDQSLGRIFGNEQITAARILYAGGAADVDKWTKAVNDQGYAADTAATKLDNLRGDLEQLKGSLETALINSGSGSQGALRDLTQGLTDVVNLYNKLPGAAQNATTGLLGITAVTGGGLWFTAKTIKGVADMRAAIEGLGDSGTKAAAALKGVGLAGASVAILYTVAAGIEALNKSIDRALPGVNELTKDLLNLQTARGVQAIVSDVGDLGAALEKIKDPGFFNDVDKLYGKVPVLGKLGQLGVSLLPGGEQSKRDLREATASIEALDGALSNIVSSGSPEQAQAVFDQLATTFGLSADQQERLKDLLPQYKEALDGATVSTMLNADGTTAASAAMSTFAQDQEAAAKAIEESRKAASETAHEFFGLGDSVDDSKVSLDGWIKDLEKQASALRDFTKNAQTAAKKGLKEGLIKELEAAGPAGAMRLKQLADASRDEIRRANKAWKDGQKAIDDYVDTVGGVPPTVASELVLRTQAAEAALRRIMRQMADIPPRLQTDYYVIQHNALVKPRVLPGSAGQADGGTIEGPRWPYGDKVLTPTAPGEEVISNRHGQADKWRPLLKAINSGLADGGTVMVPAAAGGSFDYGRMAAANSGNRLMAFRDARNAHLEALRIALREIPFVRTDGDLGLIGAVG